MLEIFPTVLPRTKAGKGRKRGLKGKRNKRGER